MVDPEGTRQAMTALAEILRQRIAQHGPITLADYMGECLLHPKHGYYTQQEAFGRSGDFITAPEISQMFGEMIGLALGATWQAQGAAKDAIVAELGPGRGTLMQDLRRIAPAVPGFESLPIHMIEAAPKLRQLQSDALPGVIHHAEASGLPQAPLFLIANEFFDALPIRQFRRHAAGWEEILVGCDANGLRFGKAAPQLYPFLDNRLEDTKTGMIVEYCPALPPIVAELAQRIADHGGAALIIDYGDWRSQGDTVQAVNHHQPADPLAAPGTADLTAHLDFEALYNAAKAAGLRPTRLTTQGVFLERLGLTQRAQTLAKSLSGAALDSHIAAHRRLSHPDEMGGLFKVMGLVAEGAAVPPGLEP